MRYLVAFDKFKDCMSAERACEVALRAILRVRPSAEVDAVLLTDGGEGFCGILTGAAGGRIESVEVTGPRGERREASVGFVNTEKLNADVLQMLGAEKAGEIAVIETAQASGLWCVPEAMRDPWTATSRGTGEMIAYAARHGAKAIVIGIGGSATCDLGLGALEALGLGCVLRGKAERGILPQQWDALSGFDGGIAPLPPIVVACDVANPLTGPDGSAAVFGPQKGLKAADVAKMDAGMERVGRMLLTHFDCDESQLAAPSGGAAGGMGFGLRAACGARFVPGFDLVGRWLDLERKIGAADVVLTGEGRFDSSSLSGKGPAGIARRALDAGKRVVVMAGSVESAAARKLSANGGNVACVGIAPEGMPLAEALKSGETLLAEAVAGWFAQ
jgi:glycerate 2-kinase